MQTSHQPTKFPEGTEKWGYKLSKLTTKTKRLFIFKLCSNIAILIFLLGLIKVWGGLVVSPTHTYAFQSGDNAPLPHPMAPKPLYKNRQKIHLKTKITYVLEQIHFNSLHKTKR